jgi:hypothetical protein
LYRVLDFQGKLKLSTITEDSDFTIPEGFSDWLRILKEDEYLPNEFEITKAFDPFLIETSGACSPHKKNSTAGWLIGVIELVRQGFLDSMRTVLFTYPNRSTSMTNAFYLLNRIESKLPSFKYDPMLSLGKLSCKLEPGKIRVFAMVDAFTQWLLEPLHSAIFDFIRPLKQDATFDQLGRLEEFMKNRSGKIYSYDLSAATDRLPVAIQKVILEIFVDSEFANAWEHLLVGRSYHLRNSFLNVDQTLRYKVGQPMGALSSWGMLAVSHHLIVQFAAFKVYNKYFWFKDYLVLGDDIVIADPKVAKIYFILMTKVLKVEINLSKSITSFRGVCEFAKRFRSSDVDYTPLSLKEFSSYGGHPNAFIEMISRLKPSNYTIARLLGKGSIGAGNVNHLSHLIDWIKTTSSDEFNLVKGFYNTIPSKFSHSEKVGIIKYYFYSHIWDSLLPLAANKIERVISQPMRKEDFVMSLWTQHFPSQVERLDLCSFLSTPLANQLYWGADHSSVIKVGTLIRKEWDYSKINIEELSTYFSLNINSLFKEPGISLMKKDTTKSLWLKNWEDIDKRIRLLKDFNLYLQNSVWVTQKFDSIDPKLINKDIPKFDSQDGES